MKRAQQAWNVGEHRECEGQFASVSEIWRNCSCYHTLARYYESVVTTRKKVNGEWQNLTPPTPPPTNRFTDRHQNLHRWLCRRYLPRVKILSRSDFAHRFVYSAIFRFPGILQIAQIQVARTDFDIQNVKNALTRKDQPFVVTKPKFEI